MSRAAFIFAWVVAPIVFVSWLTWIPAVWNGPVGEVLAAIMLGALGVWFVWHVLSRDVWPALCRLGSWLGRD